MPPRPLHRQSGVTLIELLVGLLIGLLIIATAITALMISRGIKGTVSDASDIQQQGAYALRVIGGQIRQAMALPLHLFPGDSASDRYSPVAVGRSVSDSLGLRHGGPLLGFADYHGATTQGTSPVANCLGESNPAGNHSNFRLEGDELQCSDGSDHFVPVVQHVAQFQVRYLLQTHAAAGASHIRYIDADDIESTIAATPSGWAAVQAMEVCLELYGQEPLTLPEGSSYMGCRGPVQYSSLPAPRQRRLHLSFRSLFQLRSQGMTALHS